MPLKVCLWKYYAAVRFVMEEGTRGLGLNEGWLRLWNYHTTVCRG